MAETHPQETSNLANQSREIDDKQGKYEIGNK